jgi:predicted O-linked N-acetylglucosamine transferase (SPINDLY family)
MTTQANAAASLPGPDDAEWLAWFVATASDTVAPLHSPEELDRRLARISFDQLVNAIEKIGVNVGRQSAILLYQRWIATHAGGHPYLFVAWFNLGAELSSAGDRAKALVAYQSALALRPGLHVAKVNLGLTLEALGQSEAALQTWDQALQPDSERCVLLNHRGRLLEHLGRLEEAEATLRASLHADPHQPDAVQHWVHLRQKLCEWPVLCEAIPGLTRDDLLAQSGPLGALALTEDVAVQRAITAGWIARKTRPAPQRLSPPQGYRHERLRIGYMSSDFCNHAMSMLIGEVIERHHRGRFEVYGYCSSPEDGTAIRRRILAAFDHVRLIRTLPDEQAARLIRDDEIDILVDLNGLTAGARLTILRWKPAPIQATYLGFVGPVPVPELDYLFCDSFVVPPELARAYAPRPLAIAPTYQANDRRRMIGPPMTRQEAGLPEGRFVFCCFSNYYKITETLFGAWTTILRRVEGGVLWLVGGSQRVRRNLRDRAAASGIDPARLIFAERVPPELYMARLACADLFLDTFPYNAGTVASDAIRMQLPLLTLCGRSFASRMAARFLLALGAERGIVGSLDEYVETAVTLATDAQAYAEYRARFIGDAWERTLGDTDGFVAAYEATLDELQKRLAAGQGAEVVQAVARST